MEVSRIRDGALEAVRRGWFAEGVERRVSSGVETLFWSDSWLGGVPLSVRISDCSTCPFTGRA
jgi:hypothetical protein